MPINTPFEFLKKKENVEYKKPIIVADYRDGNVVLLQKKAAGGAIRNVSQLLTAIANASSVYFRLPLTDYICTISSKPSIF
jgi:hypothetical protein